MSRLLVSGGGFSQGIAAFFIHNTMRCCKMIPIYIFDLDGTLTDTTHRQRFLAQEPKDWDAFNAACGNDQPVDNMVELAKRLWYSSGVLWIWTGRCVSTRDVTKAWLAKYGVRYQSLLMRGVGDHRHDTELKKEWLDALPFSSKQNIVAVFEDRDRMVKMYRDAGLTCLQVKEGAF